MANLCLSSQSHLPLPQPPPQPPNLTVSADGIDQSADQELSKPAVTDNVKGAAQNVQTGSTIDPADDSATKLSKPIKWSSHVKNTTSYPDQILRQHLNKPLPALPPNHPIDRTSKDVRMQLEALTAQCDHITGIESSNRSDMSLRTHSSHQYLTEKVKMPEIRTHLPEQVKIRDVDMSYNAKQRKRASISTLGTISSSGGRQLNDRRSAGSLLDCYSSSRNSGSFVSILRAKASLISIGPKRASRRLEFTDGEQSQEKETLMTFLPSSEKLKEIEDVHISDCPVTTEDRFESAAQNNEKLPSPKKTTDADFRQIAKRLDNISENRSRAQRRFRGLGYHHHLPSFLQALEDSDTDLDNATSNPNLQSFEEVLRESPPDVRQDTTNIKKTLLLQVPHITKSKPTNKPTSFRLASLKNVPLPQLFQQQSSVFEKNKKGTTVKAHAESRGDDDKKPFSPSLAAIPSVHYEITSSISPLASVKPTDSFQDVPVSVSEAQYQAFRTFPTLVKDGNSNLSALKEKREILRTRPRAATSPSLYYGRNKAEEVVDNLHPEHDPILFAREGQSKSSTWAYGDNVKPSRPTVLPQVVQHDFHEGQPAIDADLQIPKTPEKPIPLSHSCSDSTPSLQACDSIISLNDEPTPVTVIRVDPFEANPNSPSVIRIYPFPSPPKPSQFDPEFASETAILTHESLASHIAKLDLGPPPPIPPRHPARKAKASNSPSAKPKRGHSRRVSVNKKGEPLDVPAIRADVAHLAATHPIPSPKYIEIALTPTPPPPKSSIVRSQPLENPFIVRRSISSHSIRGHPPIPSNNNHSSRISQAPHRDSAGSPSDITYTPKNSSDSSSNSSSNLLHSRTNIVDFRTKYTNAIDSIMLELDEMRSQYVHAKPEPKPKPKCHPNPVPSSAGQTATTLELDKTDNDLSSEREPLLNEYHECSLKSYSTSKDCHNISPPDLPFQHELDCGSPHSADGKHREGCSYWKDTESEFGEIRTPPPLSPPSLLTPPSSSSNSNSSPFGTGDDIVWQARGTHDEGKRIGGIGSGKNSDRRREQPRPFWDRDGRALWYRKRLPQLLTDFAPVP